MAQAEPKSSRPGESSLFDNLPAEHGSAWPVIARLVRETMVPNWKKVLVMVAAIAALAVTGGTLPFLLQRVADDVFVAKDPALLFILPATILVMMALRAAADWISAIAESSLGTKIVADLRLRMFDTIAAADLAWLQRTHSGRFVSAFVNDTSIVDRAGARVLITIVKQGLSVLVLVGAMIYMDPVLSAIILLGLPVVVFHLGQQRRRIRHSVKRSLQESGDLGSMLAQTIQNIRVVKAYGQETREASRFREIVGNVRKYLMRTSRSRAAVGPVSEAMSGLGIAAAILYGGWQGVYGDLSLGHFMGFMAAAMLAFQPLKSLVSAQAILSEGVLAASRVFALIDRAPLVADMPGAAPLEVRSGSIAFRNVDFGYEPGELILSEFSLDVAAGQKVALVGPSGAGKSTVLNLILRFFDPLRGEVLIDGQPLRGATLASVRAVSALLTQDPVLFDDTVAANIAYGSPDAAPEDIAAAAEAAAAHEFIMRLPKGYETYVGEAGNRLSGGERQRIAFARAMLRNTPILLLDEPTSALDAESEAKVQAAMERLLQGRTVVMIAHRLSTVQKADVICVMEHGRITESGTHAQLVARRGKYSRMFHSQFQTDEPRRALAGG